MSCIEFFLIASLDTVRHEQLFPKGTQTKGWSYETGYDKNFDTDVYPLRGLAANNKNELKIRLQMNIKDLVNANVDVYDNNNGFAVSCLCC